MKTKALTLLGLLIIVSFSLSACGTEQVEDSKKPFFITIESIVNSGDMLWLNKPGKVLGEQTIIVTSQVRARVKDIKEQVGQDVEVDQLVMQLSDDIANYNSQVKRAKTALNNAILNYNQNKINIDSSIASTETQLNQASQSYQTSKDSAEQSINKASQSLENAGLQEGSPTALNIEKIVTDIENKVNTLKSQYQLQRTQLVNILDDVLHQGDSILGVTSKYVSINSSFKVYLGGADILQKQNTERLLLDLYTVRNDMNGLTTSDPSNLQMVNSLIIFKNNYKKIDLFLAEVQKTLNNSIAGTSFPQTQIDGYIGVFNGLQASSQTSKAGFISYESMVNSLLGDIQFDSSLSEKDVVNNIAKQQIQIAIKNAKEAEASAKIVLESTKINTENAISNAKTAFESAQINYSSITKNRNNQIGLLANAVTQARISYQDALTIYKKLSVKSPIGGIIGDIFIDRGQEVGPGTPLFSIISDKDNIIEIFVTSDEHDLIQIGQIVKIDYDGQLLTGSIVNMSYVAGPTILYKVQMKLSGSVELIGDIATVEIPINIGKLVLDINSVTPLQDGKGFIYILNEGSQAERIYVDLGETRSDKIEITSSLPRDIKIITSDISNYNPEKFQLIVRDNNTKQTK